MATEIRSDEHKTQEPKVIHKGSGSGAVYGFGLIGAWVYYISHATTFWLGVLGIFKGIIWPALLVYELLKYLNM